MEKKLTPEASWCFAHWGEWSSGRGVFRSAALSTCVGSDSEDSPLSSCIPRLPSSPCLPNPTLTLLLEALPLPTPLTSLTFNIGCLGSTSNEAIEPAMSNEGEGEAARLFCIEEEDVFAPPDILLRADRDEDAFSPTPIGWLWRLNGIWTFTFTIFLSLGRDLQYMIGKDMRPHAPLLVPHDFT